ncbi:mitochondrial carrier domain-containing protein [Mycena maculata]|uniref:Mitochondrial carrier domain-containing protein n=1 Tax=Mycena maculata TaxID=230809 RepID=A0AAD7NBY3_9AGAR|nr:mitochondrial carrier domain-containing protein [Mycena maculata]
MALLFGITMPFVGVLVRYRANYTPKRLQGLAGEEAAEDPVASIGYFGMMKRVHRIEGWAGLYKGIMPSIVTSLIAIVVVSPLAIFLSPGHRVLPNGQVSVPPQFVLGPMWILNFALSLVPSLLLIPMQIITNRTITTPHTLAAFAPSAALRVLLSPAERAQPLRLYLSPGVALAVLLEAFFTPLLSLLLALALPHLFRAHHGSLMYLAVALPTVVFGTALLTPLQVMFTRLTLQRRGETPDAPAVADAPPAYAEDVLDVRTQQAPYTSLFDCARQIVREEGWRVLYRAWWLTALSLVLAMGAPMVPLAPPV